MQSIASLVARRLAQLAPAVNFPRVERIELPDSHSNPCKDAEFGLLVLEDGSTGLFYVWLDGISKALGGLDVTSFQGVTPESLLPHVSYPGIERRALGLGVMNAMTQYLLKRADYHLDATGSVGGTRFTANDRVGMVGLFPSLVQQLDSDGVEFIVIEKKHHLLGTQHPFEVTRSGWWCWDRVPVVCPTMCSSTACTL